jgi:hypothetical protein
VKDLEKEVSSGQIQITQLREGLRLNLAQDILFRSGSATLEPYGVELLTRCRTSSPSIRSRSRCRAYRQRSGLQVLALGHELGARGRARGVGRAAVREAGPRPGAPARGLVRRARAGRRQSTPEGRARNRRIEIRLKPIDGDRPRTRPSTGGTAAEAAAPTP